MSSNPKALRYLGDGSLTVRGIQPRDLTEEDIAALGPVLVNHAEASGLYERVKATEARTINTTPPGDEGDGAPAEKPFAGKDS